MPRPRLRRLLRISLRTTLVVVTVLCLLVGLKVRRAERQKEAVAWVKKIGGNVGYDYEHHENGKPIDDPRLPGPQWLLDYLGVDYFASVEFVWIDYSNVADLSPLVNLPNLRQLSVLRADKLTDISPLSELTGLQWLQLWSTSVTDLSPLAKLTKLKRLELDCWHVDDITPLANLTKLETLSLLNYSADLVALKNLTSLKTLCLVTDNTDLSALANLTNLKELMLGGDAITDLSELASLTRLEELSLGGPPDIHGPAVTDLSPLANLVNLKILKLPSNSYDISRDGSNLLHPLANLTNLQELDLGMADVTHEEVATLQKALPNCKIHGMILRLRLTPEEIEKAERVPAKTDLPSPPHGKTES